MCFDADDVRFCGNCGARLFAMNEEVVKDGKRYCEGCITED